ncbi:MAG: DUF5763 domain-containing protein [Ferruginibacter sp.]
MKCIQIVFLLIFSLNVKAQTFYKTPSGERYHLSTCRMVNNVSQAITLEAAIKKGLTPCKICAPPSTEKISLQQNMAKGESNTVQCKGLTKSGTRCKHKTSIANGYCFQHNPD